MTVTGAFQVSVYALVSLAGLMLWLAEGGRCPQSATLPLAVVSYFFTERWKVLRLSVLWANVLGLVAFLLAMGELFGVDVLRHLLYGGPLVQRNLEAPILSGAHLIVYLSWILLFMEKRARQYWSMCALAVLHVAMGSLLSNSELYGALLVIFMFSAIWTLSLFSLHEVQSRFSASESDEQQRSSATPANSENGHRAGHFARRRRLVPLSRISLRSASTARGSFQLDPDMRWISFRFVMATLGTAAVAMTIATCFFIFIPRLWARDRSIESSGGTAGARTISGFTTEVRLGDFGEALESTARVMEIRVYDADNQRLDLETYTSQLGYAEPLFRGAVLDRYRDGTWSVSNDSEYGIDQLSTEPFNPGVVRQEIHLQPIGTNLLFGIHPVEAARLSNLPAPVNISDVTAMLYRPEAAGSGVSVSYTVFSPRWPAEAGTISTVDYFAVTLNRRTREVFLALPEADLERLRQLARRVAGWTNPRAAPPGSGVMAQRLEAYLRDSGEFSYSLDMSIDDPSIDPVEDFLFNRKKGHCEYFASALALMLRAVNVPARLVSGFKGGVINEISGDYLVEQRHAHAWVEAFIMEEKRWVTFDATPALARAESVESFADSSRTARDLASYVQSSWSRYVVNMDYERQYSQLYTPLLLAARDWWEDYGVGSESFESRKHAVRETYASLRSTWAGAALLGLAGTAGALVIVWIVSRRSPAFKRRLSALLRRQTAAESALVDFYERFRRLCAAQGLNRDSCQTQREFAVDVRQRLSAELLSLELSSFPQELVDSFYQVRFGNVGIAPERAERLRLQLVRLESGLADQSGRSHTRPRRRVVQTPGKAD